MLKQRIATLGRQAAKQFPEKKPAYVNPLWATMTPCETIEEWSRLCKKSELVAEEIQRRRDAGIDFPIIDTEQL
jgi:hypothetical protein